MEMLYESKIFDYTLESVVKENYIVVTYYLEDTIENVDFIDHFQKIQEIVLECSTGSWVKIKEETPEVREKLSGKADRVIMNLPETAIEYVDIACEALKTKGGIIHYYSFVNASEQLEKTKVRLTEEVYKNHRKINKIQVAKTVREVAPYTWQVVLDAQIQ